MEMERSFFFEVGMLGGSNSQHDLSLLKSFVFLSYLILPFSYFHLSELLYNDETL